MKPNDAISTATDECLQPPVPHASPGRMEPPDEPLDPDYDPPDASMADDLWNVFIADEDERDPLPEPGDFWGSAAPWDEEPD